MEAVFHPRRQWLRKSCQNRPVWLHSFVAALNVKMALWDNLRVTCQFLQPFPPPCVFLTRDKLTIRYNSSDTRSVEEIATALFTTEQGDISFSVRMGTDSGASLKLLTAKHNNSLSKDNPWDTSKTRRISWRMHSSAKAENIKPKFVTLLQVFQGCCSISTSFYFFAICMQ